MGPFPRNLPVIPDLSAIIVSHLTADESLACAASLRQELEESGISGEIVLVDCASGGDQQARLRKADADTLVLLPENRGYSGGVNAGLARARAPLLVLCNADVVFSSGSLAPLAAAAARPETGAAGPLCAWDSDGRIFMPPGFAPGFFRDLLQLSPGRLPRIDERRFAAQARKTLRLWSEGGSVENLTGAVLAVRRDVFDRIGRFDERFAFEYEETEWEERVRAGAFELRYEPRARVRHLYARSSTRNPESAAKRAASRRRYAHRRYGKLGSRLLDLASSLARPVPVPSLAEPVFPPRSGAWLAISPNPTLLPFAGASLDEGFAFPAEIRASLPRGSRLYLRIFRAADGLPLETFLWESAA